MTTLRTCRLCHVEKELDLFIRHNRKGKVDYEHVCQECDRNRRRIQAAGRVHMVPVVVVTDPMSDAWDTSGINLEKVSRKNLKAEFLADQPLNQTLRRLRVLTLIRLRPASYLARIAAEVYEVEL
jgi:hypothetical protein